MVTLRNRGQDVTSDTPDGWEIIGGLPIPGARLSASDASEWEEWMAAKCDLHQIGEERELLDLLRRSEELGAILAGALGLGRDGSPVELGASAIVTTAALLGEFEDAIEDLGYWPVDDSIIRNMRRGFADGIRNGKCWALSVPD